MKAETLDRGRLAVTNPIDDTHETFKHLKDAGITEAQAEVFTQTFKGLADQTMQVNENLLMVRDELRGEITGVHGEIVGIRGELKDIHHKIDSNHQKLDAKIDSNYQKLDAKMDSNYQSLDAKMDSNYQSLDAKADARHAQILVSSMRWNIGMFIGLAGLIIALA